MKTHAMLGFILIAAGIVALAYLGIAYTTSENAVDLAPIMSAAERTSTLPLPPIVGALSLVGGIAVLVKGSKKREKAPQRRNRSWLM